MNMATTSKSGAGRFTFSVGSAAKPSPTKTTTTYVTSSGGGSPSSPTAAPYTPPKPPPLGTSYYQNLASSQDITVTRAIPTGGQVQTSFEKSGQVTGIKYIPPEVKEGITAATEKFKVQQQEYVAVTKYRQEQTAGEEYITSKTEIAAVPVLGGIRGRPNQGAGRFTVGVGSEKKTLTQQTQEFFETPKRTGIESLVGFPESLTKQAVGGLVVPAIAAYELYTKPSKIKPIDIKPEQAFKTGLEFYPNIIKGLGERVLTPIETTRKLTTSAGRTAVIIGEEFGGAAAIRQSLQEGDIGKAAATATLGIVGARLMGSKALVTREIPSFTKAVGKSDVPLGELGAEFGGRTTGATGQFLTQTLKPKIIIENLARKTKIVADETLYGESASIIKKISRTESEEAIAGRIARGSRGITDKISDNLPRTDAELPSTVKDVVKSVSTDEAGRLVSGEFVERPLTGREPGTKSLLDLKIEKPPKLGEPETFAGKLTTRTSKEYLGGLIKKVEIIGKIKLPKTEMVIKDLELLYKRGVPKGGKLTYGKEFITYDVKAGGYAFKTGEGGVGFAKGASVRYAQEANIYVAKGKGKAIAQIDLKNLPVEFKRGYSLFKVEKFKQLEPLKKASKAKKLKGEDKTLEYLKKEYQRENIRKDLKKLDEKLLRGKKEKPIETSTGQFLKMKKPKIKKQPEEYKPTIEEEQLYVPSGSIAAGLVFAPTRTISIPSAPFKVGLIPKISTRAGQEFKQQIIQKQTPTIKSELRQIQIFKQDLKLDNRLKEITGMKPRQDYGQRTIPFIAQITTQIPEQKIITIPKLTQITRLMPRITPRITPPFAKQTPFILPPFFESRESRRRQAGKPISLYKEFRNPLGSPKLLLGGKLRGFKYGRRRKSIKRN